MFPLRKDPFQIILAMLQKIEIIFCLKPFTSQFQVFLRLRKMMVLGLRDLLFRFRLILKILPL